MLSFIPMFGVAYIGFLCLNLFGFTSYLFDDALSWILASGVKHTITYGEIVIILGLILGFIETLKSTKTSKLAIVDHGLSFVVFVIYIITYITAPWAANSIFLIFTLFAGFDVLGGLSTTISSARRDFGMGG